MTKNVKRLSQALLGKFSDSNGRPVTGKLSAPADLTAEIDALQQLIVGDTWQSASGAKVFEFLHQDNYCIALSFAPTEDEQASLYEQSENTINTIDVPGSIFLLLAERLDLRPIQLDPQWVEEHIAGPAEEDGVDLDVIKKCLEGVSVFQLSNESIFRKQTPGRYVANYICTFDSRFTSGNRLTPRSLEIVREIFLQEKYYLIEENLFSAMTTPLLQHAFLEIYRILEFVFVLPRAGSLLEQLRLAAVSLNIKILDFARSCNKELGWKRVERDSIGKLFREYAASNYGAFQALAQDCKPFSGFTVPLATDPEDQRTVFVDKQADKYYALRNQIVHQFWPEEVVPCDDADWQALIEFTLGCIAYFYNRYLSKTA
ncbi:hypothetical protein [Burkholderia sp. BCC1640]|uniref:hypothetical protein n=1 Tax=Burkholderia sp. BCC1640 TaxID=2676294 RepID=UPI00158D741A|nr:hypothetical protein [Burkholderia sp. BCC1640]